jgi:DNA-binding NarL/FixJ family response regulator
MIKVVKLILVVAKPGRLREALCALLKATFWPEMISQVDDGPAALEIVVEHRPTLVLLDSHWPDDEVKAIVGQIKTERPQTRCLVLADTVEQQQVAKSAGADEALPKGFSTTSLLGIINKLMAWQDV